MKRRDLLAAPLLAAALAKRAQGIGAVVLAGTPEALNDIDSLAPAARAAGIATICLWSIMVEAGCLLSHGPSFGAVYQRAAYYLALVLRGLPPGEIPIEAPERSETVIHLGVAASIGLTVPIPILARADLVLE